MTSVLYPGSFDPLTIAHLGIAVISHVVRIGAVEAAPGHRPEAEDHDPLVVRRLRRMRDRRRRSRADHVGATSEEHSR